MSSSSNQVPVLSGGHIGFVDGIRGGAALWVFLAHCMIWGGWYGIPLPSAKIAVDIFMVTSGFLMVHQCRRREKTEPLDSWRTAGRFWIRRFFRIAPLYYCVLIAVWVAWQPYSHGLMTLQEANPDAWLAHPIYNPANYSVDGINTLVHATFLFGLLPQYAFSNMTPDWSIGLEMQFYAVFPLLYFLLRRKSWVALLVAGVVITEVCNHFLGRMSGPIPGTTGLFAEPSFLLLKLPLFLLGMLAGEVTSLAFRNQKARLIMSVAAMLLTVRYSIFVSLTTAIILWLSWETEANSPQENPRAFTTLNKMLGNRITRFLADTSYGVYLLHLLFIAFIGGFLFRQPAFLALSPAVRVAALTIVVGPLVYATAWGLHQVLEQPGIRLGRYLASRLFGRTPGVEANRPGPSHTLETPAGSSGNTANAMHWGCP